MEQAKRAIEWLEEEKCRCLRAPALNNCEMTEEWKNTIEMCDVAIQALKAQEVPDQTAKADKGKQHPSYVHASAINAIMAVREYGTAKYKDPENWRNVEFARYHDALLRHVLAMWNNPFAVDYESGLPHLWHVLCNGDFMCELMKDMGGAK